MIKVECLHCCTVRHAPCSGVCRLSTHAVAVDDKPIADGPALIPGRDFTVSNRH